MNNPSLLELLVGVAVAVFAFIAQEVVKYIAAGVVFRRRLVTDIGMLAHDFSEWNQPPLVALADHSDAGFSVSPIWDSGYDPTADVFSNASHISPDLFSRVVRFYSACGRFDEIRKSYNSGITKALESSNKSMWVGVLNCHLHDIAKVITEITNEGRRIIGDIVSQYGFDSRLAELSGIQNTPQRVPLVKDDPRGGEWDG